MKIAKWDLYENSKSKGYKNKSQGSFPLKLNGAGYRRMMRQKDGAAMYGCFISLCMIVHSGEDRDGTLTDDIDELALKTDMSEELIQKTIDFCSCDKMGWILASQGTAVPNQSPVVSAGQDRTGLDRTIIFSDDVEACPPSYKTKRKRTLKGQVLGEFEAFWELFGYKSGKAEAADAWLDLCPIDTITIVAIEQGAKREAQARPQMITNGRTPKMAQGWLSGRRWEDEAANDEPSTGFYVDTGDQ